MSQLHTNQLVLSVNTRQRLVNYNILTKDAIEKEMDVIIIPSIKFPIPFPEYNFLRIPFRQDKVVFLQYFGLQIPRARQIYGKVLRMSDDPIDMITGVALFLEIERYV